jgi:hypothetical protein
MSNEGKKFWRVHCHIGHHPGQWQYWYREQCCALGWPPPDPRLKSKSWQYEGTTTQDHAWQTARSALKKMQKGDWIIATLPGHRVGRIGTIVDLEVKDEQWNPIVPPGKNCPTGENGRRIVVRWELTTGPDDLSKVVKLPLSARLNTGQLQGTVRNLPVSSLDPIRKAMKDESNWETISAVFRHETALSDYLAVFPQRLENGLIAHPSEQVRERPYPDGTRSDVILLDRNSRTVIVECKQYAPTVPNLKQLERYMEWFNQQMPELGLPRGILIHGGSRRVESDVRQAASMANIELVHHELRVDFATSA